MDENSQALPFPLPCRAHLRSTTIRTLSRILSFCIDDSSLSRSQITSEPQKPGKDPSSSRNSSSSSVNELWRQGNDERPVHGVPESDNSSLDKDWVADGNPEPINAQDVDFDDVVGGESRRRGRLDESVDFEKRSMDKELIGDHNPVNVSVMESIDVKLKLLRQSEGNGESIDWNMLDMGILLNESDNTQNDTQNSAFLGRSPNIMELGQTAHQENAGGFSSCNSIEFETPSMEKDPIAREIPEQMHIQRENSCAKVSPIDHDRLKVEKLSMEKDPIIGGSTISISNLNVGSSLGESSVDMGSQKTGQIEGSDDIVDHSAAEFEHLSIEKDPTTDGSPKLIDTKQQENDGFIDNGGLPSSISSTQRDLIAESNCTSFGTKGDHNNSEQNDKECKRHEMQRKRHGLNALGCDDTNASSSRARVCSEVAIIENESDSAAADADQEMEEGEIPIDPGSLMEPHNSISEHVVCEEREEKEGNICNSFTEKGKNFAYTHKGQLIVDKKDMATSSLLAGSVVIVKKSSGGNFKEKDVKGRKDKSKKSVRKDKSEKPGSKKKDKVKGEFRNDSRQTPKMTATNNQVKAGNTTGQLKASDCLGLPAEVSEKMGDQDQEKVSTVKDAKSCEKKKRKPPTEERKAKRKLAKKRKRAEQNKKLGVKRLKLQPILKPKVVSDCKFHLKGKCQQGDKCKFSHDAVPLTKSQPCSYFAKHLCLKGDDCPFDHELSKYPCHNYVSRGFCSRGDACLFSHQKSIAEGNLVASNAANPEFLLSPHNINPKKQLNINRNSHPTVSHAPKAAANLMPKHPTQHEAAAKLKPVTQAPEGMRFLSFGEACLDDTKKTQQESLPSNKCSGVGTSNQQKQSETENLVHMNELPCKSPLSAFQSFTSSSCGSKSSLTSAHKAHSSIPALVGKYDSVSVPKQYPHNPLNTDANNNLDRNRSSGEFTTQSSAQKIQCRSTDPSQILEEFLFSGIN